MSLVSKEVSDASHGQHDRSHSVRNGGSDLLGQEPGTAEATGEVQFTLDKKDN
jgi:hypothetical protein